MNAAIIRVITKDGKTLFVDDGFSGGLWWGTYYKTAGGILRRFKSPKLPNKRHRVDAVKDLRRYAEERGLEVFTEDRSPS